MPFDAYILAPEAFPFSVTELRLLTILQQIPFVIPFDTRVQVSDVTNEASLLMRIFSRQGTESAHSAEQDRAAARRRIPPERLYDQYSYPSRLHLRRCIRKIEFRER